MQECSVPQKNRQSITWYQVKSKIFFGEIRTVVITCRDRKHQGIDSKVSSIIHLGNLIPETSIQSYNTVDVFESNVRDSLEMGFKSYSDQTLIGKYEPDARIAK